MDRKWFKTLKRELGLLFSSFHIFCTNNAQHHLIYSAVQSRTETATRFFLHSKQIWKSINSRKAKAAAKNIIYNIQPTHTWHKHNNYFSFLHFASYVHLFFFLLASFCCFWVWVSRCVLFFSFVHACMGFQESQKDIEMNGSITFLSGNGNEPSEWNSHSIPPRNYVLCIFQSKWSLYYVLAAAPRWTRNFAVVFLRWWEQKKFSRKKRETSYNNAIFISTCCINQFSI